MYGIIKYLIASLAVIFVIPGISFATGKLPVFVTILPQKYFVQQIGKDLVDVQVMVQPGADPHTYEPKPQQMVAISRAQLYFALGIEFEEANLEKITSTNPDLKIILTDHGIEKLAMAAHHHDDEHAEEDHEGEHHDEAAHDEDHDDHAGRDPHIWLSPPLVKIQSRTILAALQEADPANKSSYEANFMELMEKIDQLDADLKKTFAENKGMQFMAFHPSWGYFAHAYGLEQMPIEIEGKDPKPAQLKELIEHARENEIRVIFVQPQFSAQSAEVVAREIGGQVVFADPLAEDWMANLQEVSEKFKSALK
jgi:zinc transport system substrate-binding protein